MPENVLPDVKIKTLLPTQVMARAVRGLTYIAHPLRLRILEFKPDGKTISVKTYSPFFAFSKKTEHLAWEKSPEHRFDITID